MGVKGRRRFNDREKKNLEILEITGVSMWLYCISLSREEKDAIIEAQQVRIL